MILINSKYNTNSEVTNLSDYGLRITLTTIFISNSSESMYLMNIGSQINLHSWSVIPLSILKYFCSNDIHLHNDGSFLSNYRGNQL